MPGASINELTIPAYLVEHFADVDLQVLEGWNLIPVFIRPRLIPRGTRRDEKRFPIRELAFRTVSST
jgi:hypothetical protein